MSLPRPSLGTVARRVLRWTASLGRLGMGLAATRLLGQGDAAKGRHLRRFFESLGATGTKLGQQMSMRVDLLPWELCNELASLTDAVPPFSLAEALPRIEAAAGQPIDQVYAAIEPTPIGSASIATVWRGTLRNGARVAIKVKRPGIDAAFAADLAVFAAWTQVLEATTVVRPRFFQHLRSELVDMFAEELDLAMEARAQRVFAQAARRDGLSWLIVPDLHDRLCSPEVMVSTFQAGITASEVLSVVESDTPDALAEQGIDPRRVARRIRELGYWGQHEAPLFHADPHPGNILVQPGDRIVLLDFGAFGHTTERAARLGRRIVGRLRARDPSGAADVALVQSGPYPRLDFTTYRRGAHNTFAAWHRGGQDPTSAWWERSTAVVWLDMVERARVHQLPVNLNTLRLVRCTLLYDTLVCRLDPDISTKGFTRYARKAWRRKARRGDLGMRQPAAAMRRWGQTDQAELPARVERVRERAEALGQRLASLVQLRRGAAMATERLLRQQASRLGLWVAAAMVLAGLCQGAALWVPAAAAIGWSMGCAALAVSWQRLPRL